LVHNFSLVHDDVMDRDDTRRHRATAWTVFGVGNAILAGDALLTLAIEVLGASGGLPGRPPVAGELIRTLCAAVQALIDGQNADVSFESRTDVQLSECLHMAGNKTGALISSACALGGLAGGGELEQVDHLAKFGARLGLAFQVADDLQGIWGDPAKTGKRAHGDLRNRKKSLPVVAALQSGTAAGEELAAWFARTDDPTTAELDRAAYLVEEAGGREWSRVTLETLQDEATQHLRLVGPTAQASAELGSLARLVTGSVPRPDGEDNSAVQGAAVDLVSIDPA